MNTAVQPFLHWAVWVCGSRYAFGGMGAQYSPTLEGVVRIDASVYACPRNRRACPP